MLTSLSESFIRALMITFFVFMMMVIVEYINILWRGRLNERALPGPLRKSTLASFFGAMPGCLGAYTNVTLYEHGVLSLGALLAGMIATSGDEAFVMLSMFPGKFAILTGILFVVGLLIGVAADKLLPSRLIKYNGPHCHELVVHEKVDQRPLARPWDRLVENLSQGSLARWAILVVILTYALLVASRIIGADEEAGLRAVILVAAAACVWITLFGTDHFLKDHVWGHVITKHVPRIFLWTFGVLFIFSVLSDYIDIPMVVRENKYLMLVAAGVIGIIPQSGPHLIFVTLFADGILPFSVLLTSSIVQDGHGMLPLLAFSRRDFVLLKAIKIMIGLAIGMGAMLCGL
jgi:hypothetical protein